MPGHNMEIIANFKLNFFLVSIAMNHFGFLKAKLLHEEKLKTLTISNHR